MIIQFGDSATAGSNVTLTNDYGGNITFIGTASAGSAIIDTEGGQTFFVVHTDGGTAQAITNGGGQFDISGLTNGGMNIGSISGAAPIFWREYPHGGGQWHEHNGHGSDRGWRKCWRDRRFFGENRH